MNKSIKNNKPTKEKKQIAFVGVCGLVLSGSVFGLYEADAPSLNTQEKMEPSHAYQYKLPNKVETKLDTASEDTYQIKSVVKGHGDFKYEVAAGEVLVKVSKDVTVDSISKLATSMSSRVISYGQYSGLVRLALPNGESLESFKSKLQNEYWIQDVRYNAIARGASIGSCGSNKAEYYSRQWNLTRIQQAEACADYPDTLSSVTVAVLDTGVAYENYTDSHKTYVQANDLKQTPFTEGYDFINNDNHPNDDHQHGTHIATEIASYGKTIGVAPGVTIMPVKVLDSDATGTEFSIIEGIYYSVLKGADIVNMSLTFDRGFFPSLSFQDAIEYAVANDVVLVGASGNDGKNGVLYPAAFPDVISAGASRLAKKSNQFLDARASYSTYGYKLDLMAPGGYTDADINKDKYPDGILGEAPYIDEPDRLGYWYYSGTSQAAAHVSGAVAWLLAEGVSPDKVGYSLQMTAKAITDSSYVKTGAGEIQIQDARNWSLANANTESSMYYVNLLPWLQKSSSDASKVQAVVRIQVVDKYGKTAPAGLQIGGSWLGTYTGYNAYAVTDSKGVAVVTSPVQNKNNPLAIGFQVDSVTPAGSLVSVMPLQFYSLTPAYNHLYGQILSDPVIAESTMVFRLRPNDQSLSGIVNLSTLETSYIIKPIGPGLRSGPLAVVMNSSFAPELAMDSSNEIEEKVWNFETPLFSGRGDVPSISTKILTSSIPQVSTYVKYIVLDLDPFMGAYAPEYAFPVINGYYTNFLDANFNFSNQLQSLGSGFLASGGGFLASGGGFFASGAGFFASGGGFFASGGGFFASGGGFLASGGGFLASGGGFLASGGGFLASGGGFFASGAEFSVITSVLDMSDETLTPDNEVNYRSFATSNESEGLSIETANYIEMIDDEEVLSEMEALYFEESEIY